VYADQGEIVLYRSWLRVLVLGEKRVSELVERVRAELEKR